MSFKPMIANAYCHLLQGIPMPRGGRLASGLTGDSEVPLSHLTSYAQLAPTYMLLKPGEGIYLVGAAASAAFAVVVIIVLTGAEHACLNEELRTGIKVHEAVNCLEFWLFRYQTFLGVLAAIGALVVGWRGVQGQIAVAKKQLNASTEQNLLAQKQSSLAVHEFWSVRLEEVRRLQALVSQVRSLHPDTMRYGIVGPQHQQTVEMLEALSEDVFSRLDRYRPLRSRDSIDHYRLHLKLLTATLPHLYSIRASNPDAAGSLSENAQKHYWELTMSSLELDLFSHRKFLDDQLTMIEQLMN